MRQLTSNMRTAVLTLILVTTVCAIPEQGIMEGTINRFDKGGFITSFLHSAYNRTMLHLQLHCGDKDTGNLQIRYVIRSSPCFNEFANALANTGESSDALKFYLEEPHRENPNFEYDKMYVFDGRSGITTKYCQHTAELVDQKIKWEVNDFSSNPAPKKPSTVKKSSGENSSPETSASVAKKGKPKRAVKSRSQEVVKAPRQRNKAKSFKMDYQYLVVNSSLEHDVIAIIPADGIYLFVFEIASTSNISVHYTVKWESRSGYLSPIDYPLLPFHSVLCAVYVIFALVWFALCALRWRELLQVQYWIGGFIILGMLEQAVFVSEYKAVNRAGASVVGAIQFAEIVSCLKRTLSRMIAIIICTGFGIVKPRLGNTLHKVIAVGVIYFGFCSMEALSRVAKIQTEAMRKEQQLWTFPLIITDVCIAWWVFSALWATMRALRLRRNDTKLWLYRHFANTLIFAALASIVFMAWSMYMHSFAHCVTDYKEFWVDVGYWHLLFAVILAIVMILWRPTNNNQRYAFVPLLDSADLDDAQIWMTVGDVIHSFALILAIVMILWRPTNNNQRYAFVPLLDSADLDDEDEEAFDSEVFNSTEKLQLRSVNRKEAGEAKETSIEDELKWMEENIPSTLADKALPALVDSDEEKEQVRYELSKIQ